MEINDNAVIVDLRTLIGTANIFAKHDLYRAMWSGDAVSTSHTVVRQETKVGKEGALFNLFILTTDAPVEVSYVDVATSNRVTLLISKVLIIDSTVMMGLSLKPRNEEASVTYTYMTKVVPSEQAKADNAVADFAFVL